MSVPVIHTPLTIGYELDLRFTNYVKNAFVTALREAFANDATPKEYRYSEIQAESQIGIYRAFPKKIAAKYPCILVETDPGDVSITTLGSEEAYDIFNEAGLHTGRVYAGTMQIPVKLSILAETTTDREKLTDLVSVYVRFVFRDLFYKYNMPYLGISAGEAGEEGAGESRVIYKGEVTVRLQTEFQQKIDMGVYDAVLAINLGEVNVGSKTADLQPNTEP